MINNGAVVHVTYNYVHTRPVSVDVCVIHQVYLWRSLEPTLKRCMWSGKRSLHVTQMALNVHGLALVTKDADAFTATLPKVKNRRNSERANSQAKTGEAVSLSTTAL